MHIIAMVMSQSYQDEKLEEVNKQASEVSPDKFTTSDNLVQLLGLVLLLIFILAAAYYTSRFIGKLKLGQLKNSNFSVIDTYRISPNKMLQIVKVGNKFLVISTSKDNVNYITELEESEVQLREVGTGDKQSFKQILEKFKNNKG